MSEEHILEFSMSKAINMVLENCSLQISGIDVGIPFLVGKPGGGKTAIIQDLSNQYNFKVYSTHFAIKPIEETGGIPQFCNIEIEGKKELGTVWSIPDIFMKMHEQAKGVDMLVWLLDDSHLLTPLHMGLLYELFTERSLRGYKVPANCAMVMAGNASNKAGAKTLFSAIMNRVSYMPVYTDFDDWKVNFAIENDVHPTILSFLNRAQFQKFFHEDEQVNTPWGSPRSWTRLSNELTALENWNKEKNKVNFRIEADKLSYKANSYVSKEAAQQYAIYYKIDSEFDIDKILTNYKTFELPDEDVNRYALAFALISNYIGRNDRNKFQIALSYIIAQYMKHCSELSVMMIKELSQLEKVLKKPRLTLDIIQKIKEISPDTAIKLVKEINEINTPA